MTDAPLTDIPATAPKRENTSASVRKQQLLVKAERLADEMDVWRARNSYFHAEDERYMRFLIPPGLRVLELGCGMGSLLAGLGPSIGVGIDFSPKMIALARSRYPGLDFRVGDIEDEATIAALAGQTFDVIVMSDTIGVLEDIQETFERLRGLCTPDTRLIVAYHSGLWEPVLRFTEWLRLKMPSLSENRLSTDDISSIVTLAGFEEIKREWQQLMPKRMLGLGYLINHFAAPLPLIRRLCLRNYVVFRAGRIAAAPPASVSIVVPCRNERGNIEPAVRRIPKFAPDQEIIFVEGHSRDGTPAEIQRVIAAHPDMDIKVFTQDGKGKGDAVRKGFRMARGDLLMILDADLTMPPEELPKFYNVIASGAGEFVNGTRMIYQHEGQAMRLLNLIANRFFAIAFSYLLNQRFTDTLCGTKVLLRKHYERLAEGRDYFGPFDPFGDFDLILGAVKLNLKVIEVPIRYRARTFGETQISRFQHGWLLLRMMLFAFRKLKVISDADLPPRTQVGCSRLAH